MEAIISLVLYVSIAEITKREEAKYKFILPISLMDLEDELKV